MRLAVVLLCVLLCVPFSSANAQCPNGVCPLQHRTPVVNVARAVLTPVVAIPAKIAELQPIRSTVGLVSNVAVGAAKVVVNVPRAVASVSRRVVCGPPCPMQGPPQYVRIVHVRGCY